MEHYYSVRPEVASSPSNFSFNYGGRQIDIQTDHGVFARGQLDIGTSVLLKALEQDLHQEPIEGRFLDLGCGYGVVGIALKRLFSGVDMTFVDLNERALALTKINIARNGLRQGRVLQSDGYSALGTERFDVIVTNPPIRAGKATVYRFFDEAKDHLTDRGRLYVVIGKKQGAPSAERHLQSIYPICKRIHRESGFFVFRCEREKHVSM